MYKILYRQKNNKYDNPVSFAIYIFNLQKLSAGDIDCLFCLFRLISINKPILYLANWYDNRMKFICVNIGGVVIRHYLSSPSLYGEMKVKR